jgi:hypothetical protein
MTCKEFQEVAHELLHPESAAVESVRLGLAHTLVCEECAAYLAAQRVLDEQLGELAAVSAGAEAPPNVERALLAAFRARLSALQSQHRTPRAAAMTWRWAAPLTLAAGAAALLLAGVLHHRNTSGPDTSAHATPAQTQGAPLNALLNAPSAADAAQSTSADAAWTNGFVALPDSATGDSLDGGAILRIEMPASALSSLGLPTTGVEGDQLVPADVVVGQDGTLRAIRLATD